MGIIETSNNFLLKTQKILEKLLNFPLESQRISRNFNELPIQGNFVEKWINSLLKSLKNPLEKSKSQHASRQFYDELPRWSQADKQTNK